MTAARWACVAAALGAAAYLLLDPATADLAAQQYRAGLGGLGLWDNGWFAGHHTPAYSLLSPGLGALLGVRVTGALSAVAAAGLFGLLAQRAWGARAGTIAALWFSLGLLATLVSGRLTFLLGVVAGLGAMLALQRGRRVPACALATLTTLASPVAGLFVALAAIAWALGSPRPAPETGGAALAGRRRVGAGAAAPADSRRQASRGAALTDSSRLAAGATMALAALAPAALLGALFPEGGTEPFVASAFWPALVATGLVAAALPARERTLRVGAGVYALACVAAFAFATPLGGNVTRLGALLAGPVLAGALLAARPRTEGSTPSSATSRHGPPSPSSAAPRHGPPSPSSAAPRHGALSTGFGSRAARAAWLTQPAVLLAALALPLAYWQLYPATRDAVRASGDPSTDAAYHAPLVRFLERRSGSFRVEIPFTKNHWEAAYVARHVPLARGWERQLDRRYGALFYDGTLTAATYRAWLDEHAVAYVAVPDVPLDYSARDEAKLIARRPSYLRPVWRSAHWQVFAVRRPAPLVTGAATHITLQADGFTLRARRRGDALVRVRHTRWWAITAGRACVDRAPGGMTRVRVLRSGTVRVQARLGGSACRR